MKRAFISLVLLSACPALAQPLPWQAAPQKSAPPSRSQASAPAPAVSPHAQRIQDDRQLNRLADRYYKISAKDEKAVPRLKRLEREVRDFRLSLRRSLYDASDIIKDARKLESRIAAQRKKLEKLESPKST